MRGAVRLQANLTNHFEWWFIRGLYQHGAPKDEGNDSHGQL